MKKGIVLLLAFLLIGSVFAVIVIGNLSDRMAQQNKAADSIPAEEASDGDAIAETDAEAAEEAETEEVITLGRSVTINGVKWRYNSKLNTVLFMGIDTKATVERGSIVGNGGRSDTLILFIIDKDSNEIRMMPISRDTMVKVDIYDTMQNFLFSGNMQITMQYAFGNSASRSCRLTKNCVMDLLHGLPINSYCSLALDGITAAVDMLGGITLTLEDDWTDIDPSYVAGSTVTMDSAMVERFLRYRDTDTFGSNNTRMQRQSWFIMKMFEQMGTVGKLSTDVMLEFLSPYMETDMDGDTIQQLTSGSISDDIIVIPGENVAGEYHDEFYADSDALLELLLQVFYQKVE